MTAVDGSGKNEDRMRRAKSWLRRSRVAEANRQQAVSDEDSAAVDYEQFIFLWISFNAAYGDNFRALSESDKFNDFLKKILDRDTNQVIKTILLDTHFNAIQDLLKNHYVFEPFWKAVRDSDNHSGWRKEFINQNTVLHRNDIQAILKKVFSRLYALRNQLFHGGATFATGWGHSQVRDGSRIMASLVPEIIRIMQADMEENPDADTWGPIAYPRVGKAPDEGIKRRNGE